MEVWLQGSMKVTVNKEIGNHLRIFTMSIHMYYVTLRCRSGLALPFSPFFHSSPGVSFLKPGRGDCVIETEVCFVGVEVLVATLVELEKTVFMYVCVCTIVVCSRLFLTHKH